MTKNTIEAIQQDKGWDVTAWQSRTRDCISAFYSEHEMWLMLGRRRKYWTNTGPAGVLSFLGTWR